MESKKDYNCTHCRDMKYVFVYWFENLLDKNGVHMVEIPPEIFKQISIDLLVPCHCNVILLLSSKGKLIQCHECEGVTWRYTSAAETAGYYGKKVVNLSPEELKKMPCEYFERCPCGYDEQVPKQPLKKESVQKLFDLLKIKIPKLGFGF